MNRVLEVNVDDNGYGGVYSFVLNLILHIDKRFEIDICTFENFEKQNNIKFIESFGGKVYYCGFVGNTLVKQVHSLYNLFQLVKRNHYSAIHIHSDVSYKLLLYSLTCKLAGGVKIIVHSHSTQVDGRYRKIKKLLQVFAKPFLRFTADYFLACSNAAADWMYSDAIKKGNNFEVINNGIDVQKMKFNDNLRVQVRNEFGIPNSVRVYGHVGRFSYQKNHEFLISTFSEILKREEDSMLWLIGSSVGDDSYLRNAKQQIEDLGIQDKVVFFGLRNDLAALFQAMDVFLLPSRFEGLPLVGIEAQAAGLTGFYSDAITCELAITPYAYFLPLSDGPIVWANKIVQHGIDKRKNMTLEIIKAGYDINTEIKKLEKIYE